MFSAISKLIDAYADIMRMVISKIAAFLENFIVFFWLLATTLTVCMMFLGVDITPQIIIANVIVTFIFAHLVFSD